jgi:hypothetical protein
LGRAEEAARLANIVLVRVDDVHSLLAPFRERLGIRQLQLRLTKEGERDRLTLCLVGSREPAELAEATPEILSAFKASNQMLEKAIEAGSAAPTQIAWIAQADLAVGLRTGKTLAIVDLRPR